ncbi:MAG: ABC transporter permease [Bacteroidia bacterium]|nr:ABC transporter permease [Bacteroidia bacterium]
MNLSLFIAKRYFFSKRKKNFINIISILSVVGVAFSTASLIIVLSVFNGLGDLLGSINNSFDPPLKIESVLGKSFVVDEGFLNKIKSIAGVEIVTEVIEDFAYVRYRDADMVATIRGVSDNFIDQKRLEGHIVAGDLKLRENGVPFAIVGGGVRYTLSIAVEDDMYALQVYYIKNTKASVSLDPSKIYSRQSIRPGGVFSIEKNFDENYIFMPLDFVEELLNYENKRTALEVKISDASTIYTVQQELKKVLGEDFRVLTNEEQHKDLYRLLKLEKLFTFLALSILLLVGSINIFFSLMMLAIDKKKDITILSAVGADQDLIRRVFLTEGALISGIGATLGLIIGGTICWFQDHYGLVSMGMENAVIPNYPVKMQVLDFVYTGLVIVLVTMIVSIYPASLAAKTYSTEHLG